MPEFYAYIRRSNGSIDAENQRYDILENEEAAKLESEGKVNWIEETISGKSYADDRELGGIIESLKIDDVLFVGDVSRLGRNSLDVMEQGARVMKKKARLVCCRNKLELKDDIGSEMQFYALSLGARIERENISARTKTALARKKAEGVKLGRPVGVKSTNAKLEAHTADISKMLQNGVSKAAIARTFKVSRDTVRKFIADKDL